MSVSKIMLLVAAIFCLTAGPCPGGGVPPEDRSIATEGDGKGMQVYLDPETGRPVSPDSDRAVPLPPETAGKEKPAPLELIINPDGSGTVVFPDSMMVEEKIEIEPDGTIRPVP